MILGFTIDFPNWKTSLKEPALVGFSVRVLDGDLGPEISCAKIGFLLQIW
jgi:hypothetical protein